jgi:beta-glucanase (GH16 family)
MPSRPPCNRHAGRRRGHGGGGNLLEPLEPRWLAAAPVSAAAPVLAAGSVAVVARHVFYNHSAFDGRSARADARDDAAVAPDKVALLPGEPVTAANYTSYSRGINGLMLDLAGLPPDAAMNANDFQFRAGNNGSPETWTAAPAPRSITVRHPAGAENTRVTITWRDRAVRNTWLQVTVNANTDTGLASPDVFYLGNLVGDAGDDVTAGGADATVSPADVALVRSNVGSKPSRDGPADVDRNGRVTRADARLARRNVGASLYAAAPFGAAAGAGNEVEPPDLPGDWRLTFQDEFGGASVDPVWHPAQYWDHDLTVVGGGELEAYDPTGVSTSDGLLHLTARRDSYHGVPYVSGLVMTGGEKAVPASPKFSFLYGYVEVRAKLPAGRGLWPAVWMMPAGYDDDNGELDVVELAGGDPSHAQFALHRRGRDDVHGWDGPDFSGDFHTFGVDWQPDHVAWYIDGVERARTTDARLICREAMYPILNLAVGGAFAGTPDATTPFPAVMDVDYVRVWQN